MAKEPISGGASNDDSASIFRKYLNPALKGLNWDALIAALAKADEYVKSTAKKAFNQLFLSKASGKYLDRKASDNGFTRPNGIGISDEVFRKLAIQISAEKLTNQSFLEVLEIYYGSDALRATSDSSLEGYSISDGDTLIVDIDSQIVTVTFRNNDFTLPSSALATEVAAAITRGFELKSLTAYARAVTDVVSNKNFVRIYSGALGLRGYVRVLGGKAQNILQFPSSIPTTQTVGTTWTVDTPASLSGLTANRARITFTAGTNPSLQLIRIGDYVNIYGSPFNAANRGTFSIVNTSATFFEVENLTAVAQAGIVQISASDLSFFRPITQTLNSKSRVSLSANAKPNTTDVILAATTQAISRSVDSAAYLHSNTAFGLKSELTVTGLTRSGGNTVTATSNAHGLVTGMRVLLTKGEFDFPSGVKTITSTATNTFTYTETGANVTSVNQYLLYLNFRETTGSVTLTSLTNHNLSTGQQILVDGLVPNDNIIGSLGFSKVAGAVTNYNNSAATLLSDGRVLVCGGVDIAATSHNDTYIYDPATNTWSTAATMNSARSGHSATLLKNGRVLVVGGAAGVASTSGEIYDPTNNVWVVVKVMTNARINHSAALLNDGRVLVAGGSTVTAEAFDPTSETWTVLAAPAKDRRTAKAIVLNDGRVFIAGGFDGTNTLNTSEVYNPVNDSWTTMANMSTTRQVYSAIFLRNLGTSGKVLIIGGQNNSGTYLRTVELYDPPTNTWTTGTDMISLKSQAAVTLLSDGRVFVNGGFNGSEINETEIYDPINNIWDDTFNTDTISRRSHFAFTLNNKKVIIPGGLGGASNIELFTGQVIPTSSGVLNGLYLITVTQPNQFTYTTSDVVDSTAIIVTNGTVLTQKAVQDSAHIGPYVYNTQSGPSITSITTTITQNIVKGQNYSSLAVTDASLFPATGGYLVFGFGTNIETTPVYYTFKSTSTLLLLDSSYIFPIDIPSGTRINLLYAKGAFIPTNATELGSFYLTDSVSGRIAASDTIDSIAAAGVTINKTVVYPGDKGLGNEGLAVTGTSKIADKVFIFGNQDDIDKARE